ncbi:hypothetical protein K505DRAFT_371450 [Melanomma pulvis-pyrius CBS 109.77]|uniref:Uncharacterized protein n=1 Tax=Melanomma pulvis-pyrius CBS 109.77 TaxID=1314802 RepID=A0A6A6XQX4_9PLEO|nr:hypothetical protein K505DRAFT_371450 [Melanomma pulvis-pyrius CBS 109.77]
MMQAYEPKFSKPPLPSISIPSLGGIEVVLHRRGLRWYLVFGRAYGMAAGWKLCAQLNEPRPQDTDSSPPSSHSHLNPRFWLRDGADWELGNSMVSADDLLRDDVEPPFLKDTGLRRTVEVKTDRKEGEMKSLFANSEGCVVEERLVEVLLKADQLSQRCAYCGGWEYTYEGDKRHQKVAAGAHGRLLKGAKTVLQVLVARSRDVG